MSKRRSRKLAVIRRFKAPLIATAIILTVTIVIGLAAIAFVHNSDGSNRQKAARAGMIGTGVASAGCVAIAPFWFYAAWQFGKEKRQRLSKRS